MSCLIFAAVIFSGCTPRELGPAETYYARKYQVIDASVRRVRGEWDLRFDDLLILQLREALAIENSESRLQALTEVLGSANELGRRSAASEIRRMPPPALNELAQRASCQSTVDEVIAAYKTQSNNAYQLRTSEASAGHSWNQNFVQNMRRIERDIEPEPDEQGRFWRMLLLGWGTIPSLLGIESVEGRLEEEIPIRLQRTFDRAQPFFANIHDGSPIKLLPVIVQDWPERREYDESFDLLGRVRLAGTPQDIQVKIDTSEPTVYFYTSSAKIKGRMYDQIVYVWWYPKHPEMVKNDPAAGHIDGTTLRITYDSQHRPAVFEVLQACGCGHLIFISETLEQAAREQFGRPEESKTYCVEKKVSGRRNVYVVGVVKTGSADFLPMVYVEAGYHSINKIEFGLPEDIRRLHGSGLEYQLTSYDELDRLPLGEGVASMFGPDGLVHHAGRKEGLLLAPTGMLSAGQPRKRGTQKVRWDEYDFDDPQLLEKTLRLPNDF